VGSMLQRYSRLVLMYRFYGYDWNAWSARRAAMTSKVDDFEVR